MLVQLVIGVEHFAIGMRDSPFSKHRGDFLATTITKIGNATQQLHVRALVLIASMILNPPACVTMRTLPNRASSTDS